MFIGVSGGGGSVDVAAAGSPLRKARNLLIPDGWGVGASFTSSADAAAGSVCVFPVMNDSSLLPADAADVSGFGVNVFLRKP